MIEGDYKDDTLQAIVKIIGSVRSFIVCGSRFFGDARPQSDFDFVTDDLSLFEELKSAGWETSKSEKNEYLDLNTSHILNRGKVQIIFVESIERRIKAREYIVANKLDRNKTASWDTAYNSQPM